VAEPIAAAEGQRDNPMQTDGFEFVEYAAPDPRALGRLFEAMGFRAVARHRHKDVLLYRQGEINFIVNAEPRSFAQHFARRHGPSVARLLFGSKDAARASRGRSRCLHRNHPGPWSCHLAIKGVGDSLIYLVNR
jgi:4-hydroxyphenylpyruvate dioxygenase